MKRKHIHTRTVSRLPPEAFLEDLAVHDDKNDDFDEAYIENGINEKKEKPNYKQRYDQYGREIEADKARVIILGTEYTGKTSVFNQLRNFCGNHPIKKMN
eukprot:246205_1